MTSDPKASRTALVVLLRAKRGGMSASEKAKRKKPAKWLYPWATEHRYAQSYRAWVKPVREFVHQFLARHQEAILNGDSKDAVIRTDAVAGESFALMVQSLNGWVNAYISDDEDKKLQSPIYMGLGDIADSAFDFNGRQYDKSMKSAIGISFPDDESWWPEAREMWQDSNYETIRSDIKKYIADINTATEQAVTNGWSVKALADKIIALDTKITKSRANFIARDQIGKLNGTITQKRMQDVGLSMYVWDTSGDERVRESHAVMEGLLCRWDDATVCSYDGGRTWVPRPAGAVLMHPGMDYQCRCCADAYFNELLDEADGVEIGSGYDTTSESTDPGTDIGPIGKAKPVNSINDLKKKDTPFSIDDALEKTNPNYSKGKYEWIHNCQRCCPTYEARRRGYDVIAKPVKAKNKAELAKDKYTNYSKDRFASMFEDPDILIAEGYAKDDIIKSMQEWGDGSRCIICVIWKDWEAHTFVAEQVNGKTIFLDPQINMVYDETVFENTLFGKTKYFRSDNLDFNDNIIECCLNRKEKRKRQLKKH